MQVDTSQQCRFYIVRHGQTECNILRKLQGHADIPLNATGEEEAKELAKQFIGTQFAVAFSSDLLRAKRTAEIISLEKNIAVMTTKVLREGNYGKQE